jgi:predicted outer membrane repeat protein
VANFGGAIQADGDRSEILNCLFDQNTAQSSGGAFTSDANELRIISCTFARNHAKQQWSLGAGGALALVGVGAIYAANSIFWGNLPDQVHAEIGPNVTIDISLVEGGWRGPGQGNLHSDPRFEDLSVGNLRLSSRSPCIDAGDTTAASGIAFDLDGNTRVVDGNGDGTVVVDMGAFEFALECPANIATAGGSANTVDVDDLVTVILAWGPCPAPPATCPADVNNSGSVDVDDLVAVILAWGLCS